jgi:NADH-quinone oxidoreductase subunit J
MVLETIIFYFFALVIVASAAVVVLSKNIMYAAFSLLFTLFGVAGLYVLLTADFLAVSQIMIYIGGILVLIIFGVMLTSKITGVDIKTGPAGKVSIYMGGAIAAATAVGLGLLYKSQNWVSGPVSDPKTTINALGVSLMTDYMLAFEVAAVLLLIALIGAALIARRK